MIGTSRSQQTSKSLRVCSSMPPRRHLGRRRVAPSLTLPRERGEKGGGTAVSVRWVGVLAESLWAEILVVRKTWLTGVSSRAGSGSSSAEKRCAARHWQAAALPLDLTVKD